MMRVQLVVPAQLPGTDVPRTSAALSGGQGDLNNGTSGPERPVLLHEAPAFAGVTVAC